MSELRLANTHSAADTLINFLVVRLARAESQVVFVKIKVDYSASMALLQVVRDADPRVVPAVPTAPGELRLPPPGHSKHFPHIKRFPYVHLASNSICHDYGSIHRCRFSGWSPDDRI
jgi:hypothetical protein